MIAAPAALLDTSQQSVLRQRSFSSGDIRLHRRCRVQCKAEGKANDALSERLKAAETEANELRKQLEAARAAKGEDNGAAEEVEKPKARSSRIDGSGLKRETLFGKSADEWLSEATFLTGKGPGEAIDKVTDSPEEARIVKRRLIIGAVVTVAAIGLSILPTDALRFSRPSKPLFFYLTPLVRVQSLLGDLEKAAQDGETDEVQSGIQRIQGAPNFAVENLRNSAAALPDSRAAERARVIARDVIEYLDSIDFNKYYETLQKPSARSGEAQKMFMDFSLSSIRAAKAKLKAFFLLMPADQMDAANQQANPASE